MVIRAELEKKNRLNNVASQVVFPPDSISKATTATLALVSTGFILVFVCCCFVQAHRMRRAKLRGRRSRLDDTDTELGSTGRLEGRNIEEVDSYLPSEMAGGNRNVLEGGGGGGDAAEDSEAVMENVLKGDVGKVNPDLPLTQQTRVLNYDKRWDSQLVYRVPQQKPDAVYKVNSCKI